MKFFRRPPTVLTFDKGEYLAVIAAFKETVANLRVGNNDLPSYRGKLLHAISDLLRIVNLLDFASFDREQLHILEQLINKTLPNVEAEIVSKAPGADWWDLNHVFNEEMIVILRKLVGIHQQQILVNRPRLQPRRLELAPNASWHIADGKQIVFPEFAYPYQQVQQAYTRLRSTWERAGLKTLTHEDRYLLTAIATEYLPESIKLLQQVQDHSSLARQESLNLFVRQMAVLQRQVDTILAKETQQVLSAMEAHTRFLEQKVVKTELA